MTGYAVADAREAEQPWWRTLRTPAPLMLRYALAVVSAVLGIVSDQFVDLAPWLLLVVVLDTSATYLLDGARPLVRTKGFPSLVLVAMAAAAAAGAFTAGPGALPLMLIPAFQAGARLGSRGTVLIAGVELVAAFVVGVHSTSPVRASLVTLIQTVALALVVGLVAAWATAIRRTSQQDALLAQAGDLLRRLRSVADGLDTGFDGPASAERALEDLVQAIPMERAAVLVTYNGVHSTPLALHGAQRVPWPDPADVESPLHVTWMTGRPVATIWDEDGRVRHLAAAPLMGDAGNRVGIVVFDRSSGEVTSDEFASLQEVTDRHARAIDVAVVFEWLRSKSAMEERTRLSRVMHDGVAQELAALGYQVDAIRSRARRDDCALADELDDLRASLSRAMIDIRLHIADLRVGDHLDARLGAVISNRLQTFSAFTGIATTTQLNESGLRLPAHIEVMLYRLVLDILEDARRAEGTTAVEVHITVTAPEAAVRVWHDGCGSITAESYVDHPLVAMGADLEVIPTEPCGVQVSAHVRHYATRRLQAEVAEEAMVP